jgi:Xaa-Pro dipeptidase
MLVKERHQPFPIEPLFDIPPSSFKISRNQQQRHIFIPKAVPTLPTPFSLSSHPLKLCNQRVVKSQHSNYFTSQAKPQPQLKMADYEAILKGKYPAKAHAKKVVEWMKKKDPKVNGVLYLEGQKTSMIEDNDSEAHFRYPSISNPATPANAFRQRRYFYYLTGCPLPDCYFTYDLSTEISTLFIPPIEPDSVIWSGLPVSTSEALDLYDIDHVFTSDKLPPFLAQNKYTSSTVHAITSQVSPHISFVQFGATSFEYLKEAIEECRVIKDDFEIALTKKANSISTIAHTAVLKAAKKATNERELEGLFLEKCISNGAKEQAYHSIVASGTSAATLHYVKNYEPLAGKLNILLDAGAEYDCYASDVVSPRPFPSLFAILSRTCRTDI